MTSADVIVVGAGAAGTFAAYQLRQRNVLMLDVGHRASPSRLNGNLYDVRKSPERRDVDLFSELIGAEFESLHNIFHPYLSPKLKAPRMRFVTAGADDLSPVTSDDRFAVSFAAGGMANAWGAGLYRFTAAEFAGYPIALSDIEPYYDAITAKVGISGEDDDLAPFFGPSRALLPSVTVPSLGRTLLGRYRRRRRSMNRQGLYIGRPRLAVLTRAHDGRPAYRYEALEFFRPNDPAVYNPAYTLDELVSRGDVRYRSGVLVESYRETPTAVTVSARDSATGEPLTFTCRRLILAAGTINTTKIVLQSNADYATSLPLLDPVLSYLPFVDPLKIGGALDKSVYSAVMLIAIWNGGPDRVPMQLALYSVVGSLRSDFLFDFPLSARGTIAAAKYLTPAILLAQLSYPDATGSSVVRLAADGRLEIRRRDGDQVHLEASIVPLFRKLGYFGAIRLCRRLPPGNSFRYAGTLPMTAAPTTRYQTHTDGRLSGTRAIYIADGSTLSPLPSKNHTFTMMANAMRVADCVWRSLE